LKERALKHKTQEPSEWGNFDDSPLPLLLRFDYLEPKVAIPLLCNIDPEKSVPFCAWTYFRLTEPVVKASLERPYEEYWMANDFPEYWRIRLLSDNRESRPRCWYESLAGISDQCENWRKTLLDQLLPGASVDLSHQLHPCDLEEISKHVAAQREVAKAWKIFWSNPSHEVDPNGVWDVADFQRQVSHPPNYFIEWAESKGIEVAWLEWARARGFLVDRGKTESLSADEQSASNTLPTRDNPERVPLTEKRRKEGLTAAKMILRQKHDGGKLSERAKFNEYMKKSAVINFIRKRPGDFPECARTKQYPNRRTIKDKEPTLTKDFPDFTKDPEILAEYKWLTGKK
jgi:hypothetical protein